ncbi:MAG: nucleotidyltransferase domain-containing protein [Bacteroidia bacterium]|nr:nucleotidyltransferase domain-containing protein [Bacteroidia bacterium]
MKVVDKDPTLDQIKNFIWEVLPGSEIILFGSRARNENLTNSDYDLLIVTDNTYDSRTKLKYQALIRKELAGKNILVDVIVQSKTEIELKKKLPGHIVRSALEEGIFV